MCGCDLYTIKPLCVAPSVVQEAYYPSLVDMQSLLPDHTYAHMFGGDPECITDLTWDQLKQFHARFYHPSNSRYVPPQQL